MIKMDWQNKNENGLTKIDYKMVMKMVMKIEMKIDYTEEDLI